MLYSQILVRRPRERFGNYSSRVYHMPRRIRVYGRPAGPNGIGEGAEPEREGDVFVEDDAETCEGVTELGLGVPGCCRADDVWLATGGHFGVMVS